MEILKYDRARDASILYGSDMTLHDMTIKGKQNAAVTASGPLSVSDQGIISGDVAITLTNIANLKSTITEVNPALSANFSNIINILSALSPSENPDEIQINVKIRNGMAQAGIIPLGRIPAI